MLADLRLLMTLIAAARVAVSVGVQPAAMERRSWMLIVVMCVATVGATAIHDFLVVYEWYKLDFTWFDDQAKFEAYNKKMYDARNNVIQNVKIWKGEAFLAVPRSKNGVPATLVKVPSEPGMSASASPRLEPFPSWTFQELGNCAYLQNVRAIEVDRDGFIWVADSGTVEEFDDPVTRCPPKLLIFDVERRALVSEYQFPANFLRNGAILTDMVIDPRGNKTAYISAVSEVDAVIVVYHNRSRSAAKVTGLPRVTPTSVKVNGTEVPFKLNKLSLALSVAQDRLFISPSWQEALYFVDVHSLRNADISSAIRPVGNLPGLSYAIILDSKDTLYYTVLEKDAIGKWNTNKKFAEGRTTVTEDKALLQFPSAFAIDCSKNLWILSNRFQTFLNNEVNLTVPNFRLLKSHIGTESYMFATPKSSASSVLASALLTVSLYLALAT